MTTLRRFRRHLVTIPLTALLALGSGGPGRAPRGFAGPRLVVEHFPTILAGERGGRDGDSPELRIDPNASDSPFAAVGSLLLHRPDGDELCTGTAITSTHVLTAAHCVVGLPPRDATFVLNVGGDETHRIQVAAIDIHPGFPSAFWPRFDFAVLTLGEELPPEVPTCDLVRSAVSLRTVVALVGYGVSGDGHTGIDWQTPFTLHTRRWGRNSIDFIGRPGRTNEGVYYFDFDAPEADGLNILGGFSLGNRVETSSAPGDSGGPALVEGEDGSCRVAGIVSFGVNFRAVAAQRYSTFGEGGGGPLVAPQAAWIDGVTGAARSLPSVSWTSDVSDDTTALVTDLDSYAFEIAPIEPRRSSPTGAQPPR